MEQREFIEVLRADYSVRQICETLGFTRSNLYYQPKSGLSEAVLRDEIEQLARRYPKYGYRRITALLMRMGYTVGYRRVARLMKSANLSVAVKRICCQTTNSIDGLRPWVNRLETLEVSRCDHVWVGDITYVRLKGRFIYVCLLMDVFTRMIRGWHISQHLTQSLTLKPLEAALCHSVPEIHHSDQGVQYLSQVPTSQCSSIMALRFPSLGEGILGRTDMPKGSSAHSRKRKFTSTPMRTSMKRERVLGILSLRCIIRNALTRR